MKEFLEHFLEEFVEDFPTEYRKASCTWIDEFILEKKNTLIAFYGNSWRYSWNIAERIKKKSEFRNPWEECEALCTFFKNILKESFNLVLKENFPKRISRNIFEETTALKEFLNFGWFYEGIFWAFSDGIRGRFSNRIS